MSTVKVTRVGDRIHARFAYSARDIESAKAADGRWSKRDKSWTFPLDLNHCLALREAFGDRLVIMPALREWAWAERQRLAELESLRDLEVPEDALKNLADLAPDLHEAISTRKYQVAGALFAIRGQRVLLGDQPGLGKTYQALAAVVESQARRVLIIAPRTAVRTVWESHVRRLCPFLVPVLAQGSRAKREAAIAEFRARVDVAADGGHGRYANALIVNKEMIRVKRMYACLTEDGREYSKAPGKKGGCPEKSQHPHRSNYYPEYPELFAEPWDYIVMDECHHALASRYNIQSDNITQIRLGAVRLPLAENGYKLAMSGTPYRSKAQKAWGTLNWLQPAQFSSFWKWAEDLFEVEQGRFARNVSQQPRDPERFADQMRPFLLARTKQEVAPELPAIEYAGTTPDGTGEDGPVGVWLDMEPAQAKAYESMRKMAEAELKGGKVMAVGVLAELTRMKQFACSFGEVSRNADDSIKVTPHLPSNKYDWLLDFLREREGFDGKVIIASQFTSLLKVFKAELEREGFKPLILTGETSDRARAEFQARIQDPADEAWIGLINMKAGGEAITLDQADDMVLLDLPWTDDEIRQMEDRIHRISRIHQVTVYRLQSKGTIEQKIAEMTDQQRKDLMALRPAGRKLLTGLLAK